MGNITDLFVSIINDFDSIDIAESEFRCRLIDDDDLKKQYKEYCREMGTTEKNGFLDFCDEYLQNQDSVWDTLRDYDE